MHYKEKLNHVRKKNHLPLANRWKQLEHQREQIKEEKPLTSFSNPTTNCRCLMWVHQSNAII